MNDGLVILSIIQDCSVIVLIDVLDSRDEEDNPEGDVDVGDPVCVRGIGDDLEHADNLDK